MMRPTRADQVNEALVRRIPRLLYYVFSVSLPSQQTASLCRLVDDALLCCREREREGCAIKEVAVELRSEG